MPRQDSMKVIVQKSIQEIFRKFVKIKGLTLNEALSDVLEMYMLSQDKELYLTLKKDCLSVEEGRNMILDKDEKISKNNALFMKLGYSKTNSGDELGGHNTIEAYMRNCSSNGYTWYSTNSLSSGMNQEKVKKYNALAEAGYLKIYFAMNQNDVDNDIAYVADVIE